MTMTDLRMVDPLLIDTCQSDLLELAVGGA